MALVKDFLKGTRIENSKWYRNSVRNRIFFSPSSGLVTLASSLVDEKQDILRSFFFVDSPSLKSVYAYVFFFFLSLIHFFPLILVQIRSLVENFLLFLEPKSKKMSELDFTWLLKFSSSTSRESAHKTHTHTHSSHFFSYLGHLLTSSFVCMCPVFLTNRVCRFRVESLNNMRTQRVARL